MGQQVTQILKQAFQGMDVNLDERTDIRLSGMVIWEGFDDQDHIERQQMIRKVLKQALGAEFQQIGLLLTYTPREISAMRSA